MERVEQIRECNACDWVGWASDCVTPKHQVSLLLCPECQETTFCITPDHVKELRDPNSNRISSDL